MKLILYTKPGCHLCEGLQEKLEQVEAVSFELEIRQITDSLNWFEKYQYEVPVLCWVNEANTPPTEEPLPRLSPRSPVVKLEELLQKYQN
ncbi:glutaredoxin 2 [Thalassoporum mexicanum PCC 7367]|uniref:glutaredoxin family protein n=1 Tax=Thalassoporum mexicanum TaxID=3457544 RepID=UPI00029FA998|nr:glutaredoxin family protein [Pseudanabaena sp. PCC 7367]AFY70191.1 glutaredoxin 2 [Pseudanabaena sp. PCC 7367]